MINRRMMKIREELTRRMMSNVGRWCEIIMKATGEKFKVIRTGYGPMEYPEKDPAELQDENGNIVYKAKDLYDLATWICERY